MNENNQDNVQQCKVVLLGETFVGKTCIINRFINNTFEADVAPTKGASFGKKTNEIDEFEEKNVQFAIWDTAGQEKYRSLSKIFYKESTIAILVYDITNKRSFNEIQKYWYKQIIENGPKNVNK